MMDTERITKILISVGTILICLGKVIQEVSKEEEGSTAGKSKKK
jgi:uncharacterized membrane protein